MLARCAAAVPFAAAPALFAYARGATPAEAADLVRLVTSLAAVGAGVASLVSWRILGKAYPAWRALALLNLGVLSFLSNGLALLAVGGRLSLGAFEQLVIGGLVVAAVVGAFRSPQVDAGLQPLRLIARSLVGGMLLIGALNVLYVDGAFPSWATEPLVQAVLQLALASCFVALGLAAVGVRVGHRGAWAPGVLVGLGLAYGTAVLSFSSFGGWALVSALLRLAAVALAAGSVAGELAAVVRSQDRHSAGLRRDVDALSAAIVDERANLEERLHDLRNAVAALRSADSTLRRYAGRLDPRTQSLLADAVSAELARLQSLLDPDPRLRNEPFRIVEAIGPVLAAEESNGLDVRLELDDVTARGDPDAFAQVVQNLLVNARCYAPEAPVRLIVRRGVGKIELRVEDSGPGIPTSERLTIFGRGERGSTSEGTAGSGLGLFISARMMAEMGGSLRLDDRTPEGRTMTRGACFVIELPEATANFEARVVARYAALGEGADGQLGVSA